MKTHIQILVAYIAIVSLILQLIPFRVFAGTGDEIMYPLREVAKLECRFEDFDKLGSDCKQNLPILNTADYQKYATQNGGYNTYTRFYTVLWGSSYKYGWDVGNGGHQGTDIATAKGTPVYSIADGTVIDAKNAIGWGNYVSVEHTIGGKKVISNYAHLDKILVKKGDAIKIGKQVGTVGSTGNSTGNHLHFQIDLPSTFHPYYYDRNACPYSYYQITEEGVCFNELAKNTIDPLYFLETNGAVLKNYTQKSQTLNTSEKNTTVHAPIVQDNSGVDMTVFNRTVYTGYSTRDIQHVQTIMRDLGYYKHDITGNYEDVLDAVIQYQVESGVIQSKNDEGAGWFGPKTRTQAQRDYLVYLANIENTEDSVAVEETQTETQDTQDDVNYVKTPTISREKLMTREEIEAMEVQEFLKEYTLGFKNIVNRVEVGGQKTMQITFKNNKDRGFRGNTPGEVSFDYNSDIIEVFPKSFFNFTDGERDISITGKNTGNTVLHVKLGDVILRTFSISVGKQGEEIAVNSGKIYTKSQVVLGDSNKAIVLLRDQYNNKIIRQSYEGRFTIQTDANVLYCIKRGTINNIRAVYARNCFDEEYTSELSFSYEDTVGGLLLFDYKILDESQTQFEIKNKEDNTLVAKEKIYVNLPKNLKTGHPYYDEIIAGLKSGNISGFKKGYFGEDTELTQREARTWIGNTMRNNNYPQSSIEPLRYEPNGVFTPITREEFLKLASRYLATGVHPQTTPSYIDTDNETETLVASALGSNYKWRDSFGDNYFQPDANIRKGEAAYLLSEMLEQTQKTDLATR